MNRVGIKKVPLIYKLSTIFLVFLLVIGGVGWVFTSFFADKTRTGLIRDNEGEIAIYSSHLTEKLKGIENAAKVLSGSPLIAPALVSRNHQDMAKANSALDRYNSGMKTSVSYLLDGKGMTIASSNRTAPDSFIGKSYQFRPYFTQAINGAPGRYFAVGVTSMKRGFYASYPVRNSQGKNIGVVVIKYDLDEQEARFSNQHSIFLVDPNGIIFLSSNHQMVLKSFWPISRETRQVLLKSKQFGEKGFEPVLAREVVDGQEITLAGENYLASRKVIFPEGWSLVIMKKTETIFLVKLFGLIITLLILIVSAVPMIIIYNTSRSAEKVRKSEEKYQLIANNSNDWIYLIRPNGKFQYISPSCERLTGYPPEVFINNSDLFLNIIHPDDKGLMKSHLEIPPKDVKPHNLEFRIITREGEICWISHSCLPVHNNQGQYIGKSGTNRDITQRKRAEQALQQSEDKFRLAFQTSPDAINIIRLEDDRYVDINQGFSDLTGFTREEIIGRTPLDLNIWVDLTDRERLAQGLRKRGYYENLEAQFRRKDGSFTTGLLSAQVLRLEGVPHLLSITRDISERKRSEQALRESEKKYRALADLLPISIFEADSALNLTSFNRTTLEVFRYKGEDYLEGMNTLQFFPPEEWQRIGENMGKVIQGTSVPGQEYTFLRKDGSTFVGLIYASPNIHENKPVGIRGAIIDITERKRTEEEKRKLEEQLQRAEKMEALGTLAGGVAHDLNNVLGIIVGYSELLLYDVEATSPLRPGLVNILNGSQRAAAMVQDLLTLARRGISGRQVLNLNKIIVDSRNSPEFENLSSYHSSVKIISDLEPDLLNISGSPVHLGKTIFNLVSNANEAMPKGGTLTIKTSNQYLDRPIQGYDEVREGDYVVLSVADTGEGIPAADLKRIFEPFYTKKVMGRSGTGLGLAVVWGTVKDHHGYIIVRSEEGKGSTFTLYFPVTREEITAEEVAIPLSEYRGKGETILIVDDVQGQRDLATTMLRKLNYDLTSVECGEAAVAYLMEHKVDLLVLDMIMDPGMDGLDTYRKVLEIHPNQKAIIVSGFSETERVNATQALGAGAYVKKPYALEKLGLAVRKELDRVL